MGAAALRACALPCTATVLNAAAYEACISNCEADNPGGVAAFDPLLQCVEGECFLTCIG